MVTHSSSAKFKSVPAVLSRSLSSHWLSYSCHYLCVWHASKGIFAVTTSCIKWSPCFSPACTTASCQHNRLAVLVARYHGTSTNNTQTSGSTWKMFSRWQWCYQVYCQMDSTAPPSCTLVVESEENGLLVHGKVPTIFSCWLDESSSGFCNWSYGEVCAINSVETSFLWIHTYFVLHKGADDDAGNENLYVYSFACIAVKTNVFPFCLLVSISCTICLLCVLSLFSVASIRTWQFHIDEACSLLSIPQHSTSLPYHWSLLVFIPVPKQNRCVIFLLCRLLISWFWSQTCLKRDNTHKRQMVHDIETSKQKGNTFVLTAIHAKLYTYRFSFPASSSAPLCLVHKHENYPSIGEVQNQEEHQYQEHPWHSWQVGHHSWLTFSGDILAHTQWDPTILLCCSCYFKPTEQHTAFAW